MNLKKVPKWAWIVAGLLAIGVFIYMKRKAAAGSTGATATGAGAPDNSTGVDDSQLASDIAAQLAASLGGQPQGTDPGAVQSPDNSALLSDLLNMLGQSQYEYGQLATGIAAGGIYTGQYPGSTAYGGGYPYDPSNPYGGSPYQPAPGQSPYQSPTAPGSPLYAYGASGIFAGYSPTAGAGFGVGSPASAGYYAAGISPSSPYTLTPTPMGAPNSPGYGSIPTAGKATPV